MTIQNLLSLQNRREFLIGGLATAMVAGHFPTTRASTLPTETINKVQDSGIHCIWLNLLGGVSQIDCWDPKPTAPVNIRGPFRTISSKTPGIFFTELFPKTAERSDHLTIIRSMNYHRPLTHEMGLQLMHSGQAVTSGNGLPMIGSTLDYLGYGHHDLPAQVLLPYSLGWNGHSIPQGQSGGNLGPEYAPLLLQNQQTVATRSNANKSKKLAECWSLENESFLLRERYGHTPFGQSCLRSRRLVEKGVRFVTVNMYSSVYHSPSWDIHGNAPFSDFSDLKNHVAPDFDRAFSALIDDLQDRGLWQKTLIVASSEFGRNPKPNAAGGRDHHNGVWSILLGGGFIPGGRVIGSSDPIAYLPAEEPIEPAQLVATIYQLFGIDYSKLFPEANRSIKPIQKLF